MQMQYAMVVFHLCEIQAPLSSLVLGHLLGNWLLFL